MPTSAEQILIENIYNRRAKDISDFAEMLSDTAESIIHDTLAGGKYVNELLQNADDAESKTAQLILVGKFLIFKHAGKHFDQADVDAICKIASHGRVKETDPNKIGNKGLGFKAVFNMASVVTIISKQYVFRFDETHPAWQDKKRYPWQVIPIWTERTKMPHAVQAYCDDESVHFIFQVRDAFLPSIQQHLETLTSRHLIFLRHIKTATCLIHPDKPDKIEKTITLQSSEPLFPVEQDTPDDFTITQLTPSDSAPLYVYKRECRFPPELIKQLQTAEHIPEKYKTFTSLPISIGIYVKEDLLTADSGDSQVFCYLPTGLNLGLKFLVNAEFLLDTSRMQMREDAIAKAWNGFILKSIFYEQVKFLSILNLRSDTWPGIFDVLSPTQPILKNLKGNFEETCNASFKQAIKGLVLTMNLTEEFVSKVGDARIDTYGFIAKFGNPALQEFCAHPDTHNLALVEELGAKPFRVADIIPVLKEPWFLEKIKDPEQNRAFIEFLADLDGKVTDTKEKGALWANLGRFVLSSGKVLKSPTEVYFPDISLKALTENLEFIEVVHSSLEGPTTKAWLGKRGVKPLHLENLIEVANAKASLAPFTLHLARHISNFTWETKPKLQKLQIETRSGKRVSAEDCYLPDALNPTQPIECFVGDNEELLLPESYLAEDEESNLIYKKFLVAIGVNENVNEKNLSRVVEAVNRSNDPQKLMAFTQWFFVAQYQGKNPQSQKILVEPLRKLNVVNQDNKILAASDCYLADQYGPAEPLEEFAPDLNYVSSEYLEDPAHKMEEWSRFFSQLGVQERIEIKVHHNQYKLVYILALLKDEPAATEYFNYLPATVKDLLPSCRAAFSEHDRIDVYVQISFINVIVTTKVFWQVLIDQWSKFGHLIRNVKFHNTDKVVPSNIHYLVDRALKSTYGPTATAAAYYGQEMADQLGNYADQLVVAAETKGFKTSQLDCLGFKTVLSLEDCQNLLNAIAKANQWQVDFEKIILIYQHLLRLKEKTSAQPPENVFLLNQLGEFVSATSLYYIVGNYLPYLHNPHFIKKPEKGFSGEEFQKMCDLMKLSAIRYNELIVQASEKQESDLKQHIQARVVFMIYLEAHQNNWAGETQRTQGAVVYQRIQGKLAELNFFCAEVLEIAYQEILVEPIDLWINRDTKTIYHCPHQSLDMQDQQKLYEFLYEYLELKCEKADFISIMTTLSEERLKAKYKGRLGEFGLEDFSAKAEETPADQKDSYLSQAPAPKRRKMVNLTVPVAEEKFPVIEKQAELNMDVDDLASSQKAAALPSTATLFAPTINQRGVQSSQKFNATPATAGVFNQAHHNTETGNRKRSAEQARLPQRGGLFSEKLTEEERRKVGYQGEKAVYDYLRKHYQEKEKYKFAQITDTEDGLGFSISSDAKTKKTIKWMNKDKEEDSGAPYDFEITVQKEAQKKIRHLEVKTSTSANQNKFQISYSTGEWAQMEADEANNKDKKNNTRSHRLFVVKADLNDDGDIIVRHIHKKLDLFQRIKDKPASVAVTDYKRISLDLEM